MSDPAAVARVVELSLVDPNMAAAVRADLRRFLQTMHLEAGKYDAAKGSPLEAREQAISYVLRGAERAANELHTALQPYDSFELAAERRRRREARQKRA